MKPEWIEYTGSDEQIEEMLDAVENGFLLNSTRAAGVFKGGDFMSSSHLSGYLEYCEVTHYLICQPHPLADMICQQARTRQPVWIRIKGYLPMNTLHEDDLVDMLTHRGAVIITTNKPNWHIPGGAEYRLSPFEEEV